MLDVGDIVTYKRNTTREYEISRVEWVDGHILYKGYDSNTMNSTHLSQESDFTLVKPVENHRGQYVVGDDVLVSSYKPIRDMRTTITPAQPIRGTIIRRYLNALRICSHIIEFDDNTRGIVNVDGMECLATYSLF